ncbi:hypothetical protein Q2T76_06390 [Lactobacillus sp. YT155]|uniref:ABC transporter permease n=1 Tax=Lactobacillus sp. YT155 TaxID=3060955 RepID=UPI00265DA632|nr:hypothetical protein [Lactobacillus sp. YT155]MDO1605685.1 hypothetical protein [Lactobacillus sp. YT155]
MTNLFKKTGFLTRTYLKKDWVILSGAIASLFALVVGVAAVLPNVYKSASSISSIVQVLKQPAMRAVIGIYHGGNSNGSLYASLMILWVALLGVIFAIIIGVRNTRSQEDSDLTELLLSRSIGRLALPMASFLELFFLYVVTFITNFAGLTLLDIDGLSSSTALLFALSFSLVGLLFGTLTILFAQLANTSSGANIMSYVALLLSYMVVIVGSQKNNTDLLWLSPLGWLSKLSLTDKNSYLPVIVATIITIVLLIIALVLQYKRDIGSGLLPKLPGRKKASMFLRGFSSLAFRNQLTSLIVWAGILFSAGLAYGSVFKDITKLASGNQLLMQMIAKQQDKMILSFSFMILGIFAILATVPGLLHIFKIKSDETKGYLELIHSKKVSRSQVFFTYGLIGMFESFIVFVASVLGIYVAQVNMMKNPIPLEDFARATLAFLPIMLVILTVGLILVTYAPKLTNLIWLVLYYGFFVNYFGKLFKMPKWAMDASLFGLVKRSWDHPLSTNYMLIFVAISVVLLIVSLVRYQKRDLVY